MSKRNRTTENARAPREYRLTARTFNDFSAIPTPGIAVDETEQPVDESTGLSNDGSLYFPGR